jgi:hypothetical protein
MCDRDLNVFLLFYYESRKGELKTRLIYEDRYDERIYTTHIHWVTSLLLSYILRYVSFTEVGSVCRVAL